MLEAVDVAGPWRWRWMLRDDSTGDIIADHVVELDPASDEVARFGDLYRYARWRAAPDRRALDEERIVAEAGAWAGRVLLGQAITSAIAAAAPVTVRVRAADPVAEGVLAWPLELAHAGGEPLAAHGDVALVYEFGSGAGRDKEPVGGTLRVLAVFSQPTRTDVVALRRARYRLVRQVRELTARHRARIELRVVQYGATRDRLARIADSGGGWDVLQLFGHGGRGVFLLEHPDGTPDEVSATVLVGLLRPAKPRVKLAVVSACQSAADATADTLRAIGLPERAEQLAGELAGAEATTGTGAPGIARALVTELDCAVVAMRYPVTDEFAIAFGDAFYERLLARGQRVDEAAARAAAEAAGGVQPAGEAAGDAVSEAAAHPAVSLVTPGVFGGRAAGLSLPVPAGDPVLDPALAAMAYFPPEPERFVGRAAAMAAASAALAPASGRGGVLLHGMAGAGKTACALELAYRHQDGFAAAAFWQAPTRDDDEFGAALANLAAALETQLGQYGFAMTGHIGTETALAAYLPRLQALLRASGVLLVLDNLETLLTAEGTWRDPRWAPLITVLTGHGGESRVIMTSRIPPTGLGGTVLGSAVLGSAVLGGTVLGGAVLTLPVHALSLDEAATLARELPNLRTLLAAEPGLVRRVLHVVQGHPKLMELADAAAADRARLDAQLADAEQAAVGLGLDAFFRNGDSSLDPDQFLAALTGWTTGALNVLTPAARLMAQFIACLEDSDRNAEVIEANWADLWRRLDRPGDPPPPGPLLDTLSRAALAQPEDGTPVSYRVHPGVAAAITAAADPQIRDATDTELAAFWVAVSRRAREGEGGEDSGVVVAAGLAAAPYLLRRADWDTAVTLLDHAIMRDRSPGVVAAALPVLRRTAAATGTPWHRSVLARALRYAGRGEAGPLLRDTLAAADAAGDYRLASVIAGDLAYLLRDAGRLGEALAVAGQKAGYSERAGRGPWTQLLNQAQRLQILARMGEHERVLAETGALRDQMGRLPARPGDTDQGTNPWNVRELILDTAHTSAVALDQWQQCLDLNAEITASKRQRGAGPHELTRTRFNDAGPLIELGRLAEADSLLRECQQVFEDHRDTPSLATVLTTRASLEAASGRAGAAADLARAAIRYSYARPEPRDIAISHHNLAYYLLETGGDRAGQRAHRLAAALIYQLTGMTHDLARTQRELAAELRDDTDGGDVLPGTLAEVIAVAERTDGVRLGELIAALQADTNVAEQALAEILTAANGPDGKHSPDGEH
jgi:tetratricopeptide (TPR) repeat protein